jgi:multiple sugar transport system substrate-binding protein
MSFSKGRFALLFMLLLVLGASIPAHAQTTTAITPEKCTAPGKLTMWVWDQNWAKVIQKSIDDWTSKYCPGAEVDLQIQPWAQYWDQLTTGAASGDLPDVFNMSQVYFFSYAQKGVLLDLQPYWDAAKVDTSKMWGSGEIGPYHWGDKNDLYAGPVNWDTITVFYNKDMFDAAKLDYPKAGWTWDDFAADAEKLTDKSKDVYGAAVYTEYQAGYANWIASTGTEPIVNAARTECTLTSPDSVRALNFLKGLYDKGYMPSVSTLGGSSADDSFNFWKSGKVAMITGGSWKLPTAFSDVKFNWDVVQLPKDTESGHSRSIVHSVGYVASSNTKNADLAANLILYLVSDEGQGFFADAGGVAPANPAVQQRWIDSFGKTDRNIQAFVDALNDSQGVTPFNEIWDTMNSELVVNIFDLNMSVEDATKKACDTITPQLATQQK